MYECVVTMQLLMLPVGQAEVTQGDSFHIKTCVFAAFYWLLSLFWMISGLIPCLRYRLYD